MRYELSDYEWTTIKPVLPNKPAAFGAYMTVAWLNGIFWVLRSGAPWRDLPAPFHDAPAAPRLSAKTRAVRSYDVVRLELGAVTSVKGESRAPGSAKNSCSHRFAIDE
jgi:hypothetical protein